MNKSVSISELCDEVCDEMPFSKKLVNYYLLHMQEFFFEENLSWPVDVIPVTKLKLERIEMDIIKFIEKQKNRKRRYELGAHFQLGIIRVIHKCEMIVQQQRQDRGDWLPFGSPDEDMREHWKEMPLQCPYIININD